MIWKPSPKAIQGAAEAYISDKGIKAVLEAAINVDRPIVDLSAMRTGRSRQPAIAEARLGSLSKLPLVVVVTGNFLNEHHDPAPQGGTINSHERNASISLKPSEAGMKSSIWAADNAPLEPCGAAAFGAPSKKKATGTCRMWEICCNRPAAMRLMPVSFFCTCW